MLNLDVFVDEYSKAKPGIKSEICLMAERVQTVFEDDNFDDTSRIASLFTTVKNGFTQKSTFFLYKQILTELYEYLYNNGKASVAACQYIQTLNADAVITDETIVTCLFGSLDDMLDFIEAAGSLNGFNSPDDLLNIKAMAILAWHGMDANAIVKVLKADVSEYKKVRDSAASRIIDITGRESDILRMYAQASTGSAIWAGRFFSYVDSRFLFRTSRADKVSADALRKTVERFNSQAYESTLKYLSLYMMTVNGILCRIYENDAGFETDYASLLDGADRSTIWWYKKLYEKWKMVYHPEEVV